jgi:hypothetical protein
MPKPKIVVNNDRMPSVKDVLDHEPSTGQVRHRRTRAVDIRKGSHERRVGE